MFKNKLLYIKMDTILEFNSDITNNDKRYHRILLDLYKYNSSIAKCYKKIILHTSDIDIKNGYKIIEYYVDDDIISNFRCDENDINIICQFDGSIQLNKNIHIYSKNKIIKLFIFFNTTIDINTILHIKYDVFIKK